MMRIKVGDTIKAIDNFYFYTRADNDWEGIVTKIADGWMVAETTKSKNTSKGRVFGELDSEHFVVIGKKIEQEAEEL